MFCKPLMVYSASCLKNTHVWVHTYMCAHTHIRTPKQTKHVGFSFNNIQAYFWSACYIHGSYCKTFFFF